MRRVDHWEYSPVYFRGFFLASILQLGPTEISRPLLQDLRSSKASCLGGGKKSFNLKTRKSADDLSVGQGGLEVMDIIQVGMFHRSWEGGSVAVDWGTSSLRWIGEARRLPEAGEILE